MDYLSTALQIAQLIGYLVVGIIFVVMIKSDVKVLKVQIDGLADNLKVLNSSFEKLGSILTKVAVQDARIGGIEDDIRELKHGKGFIRGPSGIDREYSGN